MLIDLHTLLNAQHPGAVSGISLPVDKRWEDLLSGSELIIYFSDSATEDDVQEITSFVESLDLTQPIPGIPQVEEFVNAILTNPDSMPYLFFLSQSTDLLTRYIGTRNELLAPSWNSMKPQLPETLVEFIEQKAVEMYIPIVPQN